MSPATLLAVAALGGACGLDRTAFGQTLLAHPLIAASLAGAVAGDVGMGLISGIVLTSISAPVLPVGERGIRDWTSAAVVLGATAATATRDAERGAALLAVLALAWAGGLAIHRVRAHAAGVLAARRARPGAERLDGLELEHLSLAALHAVRGGLVVGVSTWALGAGLPHVVALLAPPEMAALALFWMVAPLAGLPLLLRFHYGPGRLWPYLGLGAALGWLVLWWGPGRLVALHGISPS